MSHPPSTSDGSRRLSLCESRQPALSCQQASLMLIKRASAWEAVHQSRPKQIDEFLVNYPEFHDVIVTPQPRKVRRHLAAAERRTSLRGLHVVGAA
jgi:hypothetical protein